MLVTATAQAHKRQPGGAKRCWLLPLAPWRDTQARGLERAPAERPLWQHSSQQPHGNTLVYSATEPPNPGPPQVSEEKARVTVQVRTTPGPAGDTPRIPEAVTGGSEHAQAEGRRHQRGCHSPLGPPSFPNLHGQEGLPNKASGAPGDTRLSHQMTDCSVRPSSRGTAPRVLLAKLSAFKFIPGFKEEDRKRRKQWRRGLSSLVWTSCAFGLARV